MRLRAVALSLLICTAAPGPLPPMGGGTSRADEELEKHLDDLRRQVEGRSGSIVKREQLALEAAATLDRAAQASTTGAERRRRWAEAIGLLDRFRDRNPGHPQAREF